MRRAPIARKYGEEFTIGSTRSRSRLTLMHHAGPAVVHSLRLFGAQLAADTEAFAAPVHAPDFKSQSAPLDLTSPFRELQACLARAERAPHARQVHRVARRWLHFGDTPGAQDRAPVHPERAQR